MNIELLKRLGFSDKMALVYFELLRLGPSSVRQLADRSDLNRGSVYEALKWLKAKGLVNFYEKEAKQYFVSEDPVRLIDLARQQSAEFKETEKKVEAAIPELKSIYDRGGERPIARYFESDEIRKILEDVLDVCADSEEKLYRVYSAAGIREYLYRDFADFSEKRIARGIKVKVIAMGEGGELRGLDERKWLNNAIETPTYIIIYFGKTAYISLNAKGEAVGVAIDNRGIFETQKGIFDSLWKTLK